MNSKQQCNKSSRSTNFSGTKKMWLAITLSSPANSAVSRPLLTMITNELPVFSTENENCITYIW